MIALEENKVKLCFLCRDNASILCLTLPNGLLLLDKLYSVKLAAQVLIRSQYKCLQLKSEVQLIELTVIWFSTATCMIPLGMRDAQAWGHYTCAHAGGIYESPEVHLTRYMSLLPVKQISEWLFQDFSSLRVSLAQTFTSSKCVFPALKWHFRNDLSFVIRYS